MSTLSATSSVDYGPHEAKMQTYLREGEEHAYALGNRGPIRFNPNRSLHSNTDLKDCNLLDLSI